MAADDIGCSLAEAAEAKPYEAYLSQAQATPRSLHVVSCGLAENVVCTDQRVWMHTRRCIILHGAEERVSVGRSISTRRCAPRRTRTRRCPPSPAPPPTWCRRCCRPSPRCACHAVHLSYLRAHSTCCVTADTQEGLRCLRLGTSGMATSCRCQTYRCGMGQTRTWARTLQRCSLRWQRCRMTRSAPCTRVSCCLSQVGCSLTHCTLYVARHTMASPCRPTGCVRSSS